jgi:hypothetical protein
MHELPSLVVRPFAGKTGRHDQPGTVFFRQDVRFLWIRFHPLKRDQRHQWVGPTALCASRGSYQYEKRADTRTPERHHAILR